MVQNHAGDHMDHLRLQRRRDSYGGSSAAPAVADRVRTLPAALHPCPHSLMHEYSQARHRLAAMQAMQDLAA